MNYLFNNIPVSIPEPHPGDYKKKREHFIDVGGKWYMDNLISKPPPVNTPILSK